MLQASAQCRPLPPWGSTATRLPAKPPEAPLRREGVCLRARGNNDGNSVDSFIPTLLQPQLVRYMGSIEICSYLVYEFAFTFLFPFEPLRVSAVFILRRHRRSFPLTFCSTARKPKLLVKKVLLFFLITQVFTCCPDLKKKDANIVYSNSLIL